ncbi:hypothetical protein ACFSTD_02780 [Novosphingobium colocasiae]
MKIAFLFIAEAYQTYHGASVAMELAQRSGWDVTAYYHDPATPAEIERIRQAFGFSTAGLPADAPTAAHAPAEAGPGTIQPVQEKPSCGTMWRSLTGMTPSSLRKTAVSHCAIWASIDR